MAEQSSSANEQLSSEPASWQASVAQRSRDFALWALEHGPDYSLVVLGIILLSGLVAFTTVRMLPGTLAGNRFVTFDVIKLGNAERAVASGLIGHSAASADDALVLTEASKQVMAAISREAAGRLVVIRQAIVENDTGIPDITNAVLADLNLPVDVPTINNQAVISDDSFVTPAYQQGARTAEADRKRNATEAQTYWMNKAADANQKVAP